MEEVYEYYVQAGDTFWGLAQQFYGDGSKYPLLQQYNGKTDLYVGDVIYIPPMSHFGQTQRQQPQRQQPQRQQAQRSDANTQKAQLMLAYLGYNPGVLDGIMGRNTTNALINFQNDYGMYATGQLDQDTVNSLFSAFLEGNYNASGVVVQLLLHYAGYSPGQIDGVLGRNSQQALRNFQQASGLYASGQVDSDTLYALKQCIYGAG